jgi:hypothetical protein
MIEYQEMFQSGSKYIVKKFIEHKAASVVSGDPGAFG